MVLSPISRFPPVETVPVASPSASAVPTHLHSVLPAAIVAVTRSMSTVAAIWAGASVHAQPMVVPHKSLLASSDAPLTADSSSAPVLPMGSSSAPTGCVSVSTSSAFMMACQSSPKPATTNHQPSALEPLASGTPHKGP